jgi:starch phosphorylase
LGAGGAPLGPAGPPPGDPEAKMATATRIKDKGEAGAVEAAPAGALRDPPVRLNEVPFLKRDILEKLAYSVGKDPLVARDYDWLNAVILVVRDRLIDRWMASTRETYLGGGKRVYYLSLEFLIGRLLRDAMSNLGLRENLDAALSELGVDLDLVGRLEPDAALGNGGLGRLAACFMESMATVGVPAYGYGIRYAHGLFRQSIVDGQQVEGPENWLVHGNPWEFERREARYSVGFGGAVEAMPGEDGPLTHVWRPGEMIYAVAYDTPIAGWRGERVNTLRLWSAQAVDPIQLDRFNSGDHFGALTPLAAAEAITRVLYPSDSTPAGEELRFRQEYFFTSASLQDILRRHEQNFGTFANLPEKVAIQLNDTHPAIAVAELMRLLIDQHGYAFDAAFALTQGTIAYTNHTLLPEALESWPVHLVERMLPRHLQIIYQINAKLLGLAKDKGADDAVLRSISLIDEHNGRRVRMGQLAFVGAHSVNGVSALHADLMKRTVFRDLDEILPGRINAKTNGVTQRRWLFQCNPDLTKLVKDTIGEGFLDDFDRLRDLDEHAADAGFRDAFMGVKAANKARLAALIKERCGVAVDPAAMFDVQIKRIHEYKRQLLNILETVALYDKMRAHPQREWSPRVKIFAGKAAASYHTAKQIIRLINDVARVVNNDPAVRGLLKVVFLPNYNVSLAESIIPAADLSEQISTAGMEASGTGNMKFAMNGALTIGTLDGANVEMRQELGPENIVIFGMTADEVAEKRRAGIDPEAALRASPDLADVIAAIRHGVYSRGEPDRYHGLMDGVTRSDWFMVANDFGAYERAQRSIDTLWRRRDDWAKIAVHNTARMAWFSSDRTIREYARSIWKAPTNG